MGEHRRGMRKVEGRVRNDRRGLLSMQYSTVHDYHNL